MGKKQIRTREPLRLAETVCGWHNPPGARKCEEIPYASIRLMTSHYQWDINAQTKKTRHPGSELRFATVLANICHHRFPGFHFLFCCYTGVPFAYAHSTACLTSVAPTGLKVGGHAPANSLTNRKTASVSEHKFEPRKGRQPLVRWWSGEAAEPLLAKKRK